MPTPPLPSDLAVSKDATEPPARPAGLKAWLPLIRAAIALVVVAGLAAAGYEAYRSWNDTVAEARPRWSDARPGLLLVAAGFYALGMIPAGLFLALGINALGGRVSRRRALAAQFLGHVGKYVPGKAMVVVIRTSALVGDGVPARVVAVAIVVETLLMMAGGAALAGVILLFLPTPAWLSLAAVVATVAAAAPTAPWVLRRLVRRLTPRADRDRGWDGGIERIDGALWLRGSMASLAGWAGIGTSMTCVVMALPPGIGDVALIRIASVSTAAIALAMAVGFASLLPGGAGIRELVLTTILTTAIDPAHALMSAVAARAIFMVVEVIVAAGGWIYLRRSVATPEVSPS